MMTKALLIVLVGIILLAVGFLLAVGDPDPTQRVLGVLMVVTASVTVMEGADGIAVARHTRRRTL
jgi:hypothetical protein